MRLSGERSRRATPPPACARPGQRQARIRASTMSSDRMVRLEFDCCQHGYRHRQESVPSRRPQPAWRDLAVERAVGDAVKVESDIMMRYVAQAVENWNRLASSDTTTVANPQDPLLEANAPLVDLVEAVRALPYGRPSDRSVDGLLRERRGTCSTKHLFLAQALRERFPHTQPKIVHRVLPRRARADPRALRRRGRSRRPGGRSG